MNLKELKQSNCLLAMYIYEMPTDRALAECLYSICEQTKPVDLIIYTRGLTDEQLNIVKTLAQAPYYTLTKRNDKDELVEEKIEAKNKLNFLIANSDTDMNFAQIFNNTFNIAKINGYETISFVEPEDSFSLKWFKTAEIFMSENPDLSIFLPLVKNSINGTFTGLINEACWAEGQSEEAGKTDINLLMKYNCVNPLGAVFKIEPIAEYSELDTTGKYFPMKESLKVSHYYEFFMRMVYNDLKVFTVQRLGYEMRITRKEVFKDSTCKLPQDITSYPSERGGISPEEGRFYVELARKEYFFDKDRKKVFTPAI
jgi:hypothetical protein